jgi:protein-L-isoaspartate O-methyltransferase
MKDENKTENQLVSELVELRQQIAKLESIRGCGYKSAYISKITSISHISSIFSILSL